MTEPGFDQKSGMWWGEPISFSPEEVERIKRETTPPDWGFHFTAEQVDSPDYGVVDTFTKAVHKRSRELARNRDAYARRLLEDRIPRFLHGLIDRPRALKVLLRVVPRWRPTMTVIDLRQTTTRWGAEGYATVWGWEHGPVEGGLIFTYIDPSGLPAEVCGVR